MDNRGRAQRGLALIKEAIVRELESGPLSNADLVHRLDIASDFEGKNRNFLSWSVLGLLLGEGKVAYRGAGRDRVYFLPRPDQSQSAD
jgi:hypothetical protein